MPVVKLSTVFTLILIGMAFNSYAQSNTVSQETVAYFLGEVKMSSPTGQPFGSGISLVKRTVAPAENKITEVVLSIDSRRPTQEHTTVFDVKGSKFTVKEESGGFAGEGELIGKAWEWTGWKYTVNLTGESKGVLKGEDSLTAGGVTTKKTLFSLDGQAGVVFAEDLKPISREMYELLHAKLLPKQNP